MDSVSFSVDSGQRLAIIGPNGAGKTTLFQLISGILRPTGGRIFAFGKNITRLPPHRRAALCLGRTFQITNLFMNLTVLENVLLALHGLKSSKYNLVKPFYAHRHDLARADEILEQWKMSDRRDDPVQSLSYGEQRQLEIILAMSQERPILLLDEPTCGLSPEEAMNFVEILRALPSNITILLIDHDMDVAFGVAEMVMVLHFGTVLAIGSPEEVRSNKNVREIYMGIDDESA